MTNIPLKDIQFPGLDSNKYTFAQVDDTLTVSGKAADAKKTGDEITELKQEFNQLGLSVVNGALCVTYNV